MSSIYSEEYQCVIKTLREARIQQGITQQKLAQALGRPQSFIAKVENGERRLDVIEFTFIAHLLSVDPATVINKIIHKKNNVINEFHAPRGYRILVWDISDCER